MSQFRRIVESIVYNNLLLESEQKVDWILSQPKLVQALENRIQSDSKVPNDITVEQLLKDFDNSSIVIGKFLPWVIKMYSKGEFEYTDLGLVNNYLENFINNSHKLEKKDINSYKSLDELNNALEDIKDVKGSREAKRDTKSGAEKVYEDDKWIIVIPHTKEAAIQYGKGTKWCTAALNKNMFDYYNREGQLYIIIDKENPSEKYQFHFSSGSYMNAEDKPIDLKEFLKQNPEIKNFFKSTEYISKFNYKNWVWFDDNEIDYDDYLGAVESNGYALEYVPEKFKDYKICSIAVEDTPYALEFVPTNILDDYNFCLEAVESNGLALRFIPEKFKNYEICLKAVKDNGFTLYHVPNELIDYKMCYEAVKNDGGALYYIPNELKDSTLCSMAVEKKKVNH